MSHLCPLATLLQKVKLQPTVAQKSVVDPGKLPTGADQGRNEAGAGQGRVRMGRDSAAAISTRF